MFVRPVFACFPVVEELLEELQQEDIVHLDETPWYEKGAFKWLWVALSARIAVFHIGSRKKEELLKLITTAFTGWLVSDTAIWHIGVMKSGNGVWHT